MTRPTGRIPHASLVSCRFDVSTFCRFTPPVPSHPVTLTSPDNGRTNTAVAELDLYGDGARTRRMVVFIVVGVLAGSMCLLVPGPHMVASPVPVALGIWLGLRAKKSRAQVLNASGTCPACNEPTQFPGGVITDAPLSIPCPKCRATLAVELVE